MAISASTVSLAPKLPSREVASNLDADALNKLWAELADAYDKYYDSVEPVSVRDVIQKALSDWQDFYYGQMGIWPADGVVLWRGIYQKAVDTLAAAIPAGAKPQVPANATTQVSKTPSDEVFYVTGRVEPTVIRDVVVPTFESSFRLDSPWWLTLVVVGLPVSTYLFGRKKNR